MAKGIPNLTGIEVHRVLQTQNTSENLFLVTELQFDSQQKLGEGLASPEGKKAQEDVVNLMPFLNKPPVVAIVE
ncbi:EthD family reductase [Neobacillus sp. DY30]|uniref:EthD family reductase n=1 Tax=Neobacillus sp. DY30 TaxID=3047871 RepID=UPI0024C034B0|nr:EthD family reductase [Neobacillus sp. DY30]WHY00713.1 EthD family reductase [Neobacillus sp. DY30]